MYNLDALDTGKQISAFQRYFPTNSPRNLEANGVLRAGEFHVY